MSPAKSPKQARLMRAAKAGATFPLAKKLRASMSEQQLSDFSHTAPNRYHPSHHGK